MGHHGPPRGTGPGPKPENWEKWERAPMGPQRAPGGLVGIPMGPYRTVASPPEPLLLPRKPRPKSGPVNFFRKLELHFRRLPSISVGNSTFPKLSSELTLNPWGVPRSIRTDLDGYGQPGVPETASQANFNFSRFSVFPCQALRPAPGRSPTPKFPWWAGCS